jgi:hypothetical protein
MRNDSSFPHSLYSKHHPQPHIMQTPAGAQRLRVPIACILAGVAVLYLGERSVAAIFRSDLQQQSGFAAIEAMAAATFRSIWQSAVGDEVAGSQYANAPASTTVRKPTPASATVASRATEGAGNIPETAETTSADRILQVGAAPDASSLVAPISLENIAVFSSARAAVTDATIAKTGWRGTTSSSWNTASNWDNPANYPGTDERDLYFGQGYANAGVLAH